MALVGAYVLAGELSKGNYKNYENLLKPFIEKNQALANTSARIMKNPFYYQLLSLIPSFAIRYFKNLGLKKTAIAAKSITLKDYDETDC